MNKRWLPLALLALALLAFSCGSPVEAPDGETPTPSDSPVAVPSTQGPTPTVETATPTPITSPTPKASPTLASTPTPDRSADLAYLRCYMDTVSPPQKDFIGRYSSAVVNAAEAPMDFCSRWWAAGDFYGEVETLALLHDRCPDPSLDCLNEMRTLEEMALLELSTSVGLVEQWCQSDGNVLELPALLGEALGHAESSNSCVESMAAKLGECAHEIGQ